MKILALSGIHNSEPEHWISRWQNDDSRFVKLEHSEWNRPVCKVWVSELEAAVRYHGDNTVLVAHSLACLMVVHWAAQTALRVRSVFLVSVPDANAPSFPVDAEGFGSVPMAPLPFPCMVVSSSNDPYGSGDYMERCANAWGSRFVSVGELGHINAGSGLGIWSHGKTLLEKCFSPQVMEQ